MLSACNLGVWVGSQRAKRWLFQDLDVEFPPGTFTAVIGPNGSGKSTLLRTLCGLRPASAGTTELDGTPLQTHRPRVRAAQLAYLPQTTHPVHDLPVQDLVMLGRLPHLPRLGPPAPRDHQAVDAALEQVNAGALRTRVISTLSGGERQRVMLARMLATEASILVLDEPTAALDIRHALDILETLATLREQGKAIVVAMHDLMLADAYATHGVCLGGRAGKPAVGTRAEVLTADRLASVFGVSIRRDASGALRLALPAPPAVGV